MDLSQLGSQYSVEKTQDWDSFFSLSSLVVNDEMGSMKRLMNEALSTLTDMPLLIEDSRIA